jgi:glycosyltransferase involved in cell wall biosynthesis
VSKASRVAAHRGKVRELAKHVEVTLLMPERWGRGAGDGDEGAPGTSAEAAGGDGEPAAGAGVRRPSYDVVELPALLHGRNHLHLYRRLASVLTRGAFDLVHVDEEPYSLVTTQVGARATALGVPWLFFAWQNVDKRFPPPFGALRARAFRRAAGAIAGNEEAAVVLRTRGFTGPLAVIPQMGVDPGVFHPDAEARGDVRARLDVPERAFLAGFAGRLVREKGVDLLVDAVTQLPLAHALILGDGPERRALEGRAAERGAGNRIHFAGGVPSLEVPRWLAALDCLVLPSRTARGWKEQFGRVLVEAMAAGVPVVGSSSGEIPNVIGDAGRVFQEDDARALLAELRALAGSGALREELARRGRARAMGRFTQEKVVQDTVAFYRSLRPAAPRRVLGVTLPRGVA